MPTIAEAVRHGAAILTAAGLDADGAAAPRFEAELLLCEAAGLNRTSLIAWPERMLTAPQSEHFEALVGRRAAGEPIAYILGRGGFWGLDLVVTPDTLIPRPETELLVEWALEAWPADAPAVCADLGTGSGAIACAIARERPAWTIIALEHSPAALDVAVGNARRLGLNNVVPVRSNWMAAIAANGFDLIVANPPYVRADDPHLERGDLRFEPAGALAAGADGLDAIRIIAEQARRCLRPAGHLAIEHGWDQDASVRALLDAAGYDGIVSHRDLAGHPRMTSARQHPANACTKSDRSA